MDKEFYIIVDGEDREVNFYDVTFPNAKNRAIQSAKEVLRSDPNVILIHRKVDNGGNKQDTTIWPEL